MKAYEHKAAERLSVDEALEALQPHREYAAVLFSRLKRVVVVPDSALVLDVGAGTGGFLVACQELGYECRGLEPWDEARVTAAALSRSLGVSIEILPGVAEEIPYPVNTFDLVHANSVLEHVGDLNRVLAEIYRVLKPGGVFWFYSASAMCPRQGEIRGFPLFGWYPDRLKHRIMNWAKEAHPRLVGYTRTPAINWFTPWKARAILRSHGFRQVYDRWDLRGPDEGGQAYRFALGAIRLTRGSKLIADVLVRDCSYTAIK